MGQGSDGEVLALASQTSRNQLNRTESGASASAAVWIQRGARCPGHGVAGSLVFICSVPLRHCRIGVGAAFLRPGPGRGRRCYDPENVRRDGISSSRPEQRKYLLHTITYCK